MAAVFGFQYKQLRDQLYHDEIREVEAVEGLLYFSGDGRLHLHEEYYSHPESRQLVDRFLEVHDLQGNVLLHSDSLHGRELGPATYPHEGLAWFERRDVRLSDGTSALITSHLHPVEGRMLLIRLGYSLHPLDQSMLHLAWLLLLAMPPALVLSAWAGHRLSRFAFRPLERMAGRAEHITASRLHERLAVQNPSDELGRMGVVMNSLLERLEQSFHQMQRFTADVAHELRTPLASLRALGEQALTAEPSQSVHTLSSAVSSMLEETERLGQTVDGLLLLSRTETDAPQQSPTLFSLAEVIEEIVSLLEVLLEEKELTVRSDLSALSAAQVLADRVLIRGALLNVVHNAIKYSPPFGEIRIAYAHIEPGTQMFHQICIEDSGPGLGAGEHAQIFDRFYRGAAQAGTTGAGLGLSIAKVAVEHSGGQIFADPAYSTGLRCCIRLPVAHA
jgi:signal transduction histidine kinase